ncbi:hypothetical protein ACFO4N_17730 [Camelliibacillus cellulosilyticus]|uniref:Uncharacterized protein n=1 Tax=Camelliibacillus cellulosilyticus TaxID=2174486 RepID=A0ABV9GTB7_9BACL
MDKLITLKEQYKVILDYLNQYGDRTSKPLIDQINNILSTIDNQSFETIEKKMSMLRQMNDALYPPRNGLDEFFVWDDDFNRRKQLNTPLNNAKNLTWSILNRC